MQRREQFDLRYDRGVFLETLRKTTKKFIRSLWLLEETEANQEKNYITWPPSLLTLRQCPQYVTPQYVLRQHPVPVSHNKKKHCADF
jgi:hypothetical protein